MKKRSLKIFILLVVAFIILFIGFSSKDASGNLTLIGEILMIVGGGILGFLLDKFLTFADEMDLFLTIPILLNWNNDIRISFAYLFRIQVDGTYFLIRGNKKKKFQPVGGVYQKYDGSKAILKDIFQEDDEMKKGNEKDIRGRVKGKDLRKFIQWFESRQDREITCHREFNEELINSGILDKEKFEELHYSYLGTHKTSIFTSEYYGKEFLLADIYELELSENQKKEFSKLKENYDNAKNNSDINYAFVNEHEIRTRHTSKRKVDDFDMDINNHTYKILKGEYK